jgi:diaminohydroxyphosphoribosylaminopyrimidine deaminase/5-amino-6-(5-phosphoribosylamino)uracil reductase
MAAAIALSERGRGRTAPNPNVGCLIVRDGRVLGRGWTQPGGRPHAEAMALDQAGVFAEASPTKASGDVGGATLFVSLEPCAHRSERGPACADLIVTARPARVVVALQDPDPRTAGAGLARIAAAGIAVETGVEAAAASRAMAGFLTRQRLGRPHVTLKLGLSLDGRIALADGRSRWITGAAARAHAHLERARSDAILVGRGTLDADAPRLDVRLGGLADRSPRRVLLSRSAVSSSSFSSPAKAEAQIDDGSWAPAFAGEDKADWDVIPSPQAIAGLAQVDQLLIEGGAGVAAAFLRDDLVDRLLLYRAPILIGDGRAAIGDIGLGDLAEAHDRWRSIDSRMLGSDRLEVYERVRG